MKYEDRKKAMEKQAEDLKPLHDLFVDYIFPIMALCVAGVLLLIAITNFSGWLRS